MSTISPVFPGDLIKASFFNDLISTIDALEARVAQLEATGALGSAPVITGHSPAGDVSIPARLTVQGHNFVTDLPAGLKGNTVLIDGQPYTDFKTGSSGTALIVDAVAGLGVLPRTVSVQVVNRYGVSNVHTVRLVPAVVIPKGKLVIKHVTPELAEAEIGETYRYEFELDSQTTIAETYDLSLAFTNAEGAKVSAWAAGAQLVRETRIVLQPGDPTIVEVEITVPPKAKSVAFALIVKSLHNDAVLSRTSEPIAIVVGEAQEVSDPRITFSLRPPGPASAAKLITNDGPQRLEIAAGASADLTFMAKFDQAGDYKISAKLAPGGFAEATADVPERHVDQTPREDLKLKLEADAPGETILTLDVALANGEFHSFTSIPVRVKA